MIIESIKFSGDELSGILRSPNGVVFESATKEISQRYFPENKFNLAKFLIELFANLKLKEKYTGEIRLFSMSRNLNNLNKLIKKYKGKPSLFKKHLLKNNELIRFIKNISESEIALSMQTKAEVLLEQSIKIVDSFRWWNTKPTKNNNRYSKPKWCVMKLVRIYHALTKKIPELRHNGSQEGTDKEFSGEFYAFLLELKPLLKSMGIDLGENSSLGGNARFFLREHKKTLSFLEIETPSLEYAESWQCKY